MNPRLTRLQPYPFEKLRALLAGVTPNAALKPVDLSIGEPKHATPELVKRALAGSLDGLSSYPATSGMPALREAIATLLPLAAARLHAYLPEGGFYLWLRTPVDDCEFARALHRDYNVRVLPGSYLGRDAHGENPGAGYVRLALVASLADCSDAFERIARFATQL